MTEAGIIELIEAMIRVERGTIYAIAYERVLHAIRTGKRARDMARIIWPLVSDGRHRVLVEYADGRRGWWRPLDGPSAINPSEAGGA